jgi:peptidoglycan/xylan/chitin deacetylase (PgdA/CDA1 family)
VLHLPILSYHHLGAREESSGHRRLWISRERFEEQIAHLSRSGYRCVTLRDAAVHLRERRALRRTVVLTFDDGYESFFEIAFPILLAYRFSATVFAVTGEVGGTSRWDRGSKTKLMDWPQLRELGQAGVEVASHTASHPRLTRLPAAAAKKEMEDSRDALEQRLGFAATTLAYPYGDWNDLVARWAEEARYRAACTIVRGNLHRPQGIYRLKRVPVDEFTGLERFRRRLSPIYDITCRVRRWARKVKTDR